MNFWDFLRTGIIIVAVAAIGFIYRIGLPDYWAVCNSGKSNLRNHIADIRKFKNLPTHSLYFFIDIRENENPVVNISNSTPNFSGLNSVDQKIDQESLFDEYYFSTKNELMRKRDANIPLHKRWWVNLNGDSSSLAKAGVFFRTDFAKIIDHMKSSNVKFLSGTENDLTLSYNKSFYSSIGCLRGDWYPYHYHIGDKNKLSSEENNYSEYENGIQYGW